VIKERLLHFVRSLSTVLTFAYCLSSVIQQTHKFLSESTNPSETGNSASCALALNSYVVSLNS
ncbi:hypothetical protein S83_046725, partial [Arachis hypogaea]